MGREFELKFAATPSILSALGSALGRGREIAMETTYFDTPEGHLSAQKQTLRLRRENERTVCTLKLPCEDGGRREWECPARDLDTGIAALTALGAPTAGIMALRPALAPVCGARFTRWAYDVPTADGMAELALDQGVLCGGRKEMPLCEVEVELKSGSDRATIALASDLAAQYGLKEEKKSKFRRALSLAKD